MGLFTGQKTVAGVMSAFTTAIADLTTVEENNTSIAQNLDAERERLAAESAAATNEARNAAAIRAKLEAIVNPDA